MLPYKKVNKVLSLSMDEGYPHLWFILLLKDLQLNRQLKFLKFKHNRDKAVEF